MDVSAPIKFLPKVYAGDEEYEKGLDDILVIKKEIGESFL